jgi:hypothetical protein
MLESEGTRKMFGSLRGEMDGKYGVKEVRERVTLFISNGQVQG